uniref:Purinergic receptor P2X, ligand-gated ion channel, 3b n=1 Tax=Haplochromis burtoni TaxID=8153 RepID=A0A3Q2X6H8_HAPBU
CVCDDVHFTLVCASSLTVKSFHTKDISVRARLFAWAAVGVLLNSVFPVTLCDVFMFVCSPLCSTPMMETENFTIFIKNSIRFPTFNYTKGNFLPNITKKYISECNFDMVNNTYCPIFRVGDVVRYAQQNFTNLAEHGGVIGIKIGWMCDLDKSDDHCNPSYSFTRLDAMSQNNTVSPGYNFRFAKYFKMENGTDYRTLVKAYAIRFDVLVNGNAGKFNMIPTLINMVAAFTSVGVGTVLCDIILLNFLKGAEQYKAKKFEEVKYPALNHVLMCTQTMTKSNDSGAFSIEPYS